jgi:hypothetical protein
MFYFILKNETSSIVFTKIMLFFIPFLEIVESYTRSLKYRTGQL